MKSLEDFKQSIKGSSGLISEREYSTVTYAAPYKMVFVVGPDGKLRAKKQRGGRLVIGASRAGLINANNTPDTTATPEYSVSDMTSVKEAKESNFDPPYVLVLKRQSVRLFPNNTKVALYYSDKLNKTFSVPYGPGMNPIIQAESLIEELKNIKDKKEFLFESGESIEILSSEAKVLLSLYDHLNESNKQKLLNSLCEDKKTFIKMVDFAFNKKLL